MILIQSSRKSPAKFQLEIGLIQLRQENAFISLKDHKDNFDSHPKCRLINLSKSELGRVSKVILVDINNKIRSILKVNQWRNSSSVIEWFKSINKKPNHTFISFGIVEFYPSITEDLLDDAIAWGKTLTNIKGIWQYISFWLIHKNLWGNCNISC